MSCHLLSRKEDELNESLGEPLLYFVNTIANLVRYCYYSLTLHR